MQVLTPRMSTFILRGHIEAVHGCQVNIGIPENGHPGCPFSRKYRHPDVYIYVNKQSIAAYAL